jgi:DUF971 family protein
VNIKAAVIVTTP